VIAKGDIVSQTASWTASQWCAAIGFALIVNAIAWGTYVVVKTGKRRKMTHQELKERILNDDITDMPTYSVAGPGVGVKVEASADTNTLRAAAARGDWGVFWGWPIMTFSWTTGTQLIIVMVAIESETPLFAIGCGIFFVPLALSALAMPFVALFSKPPEEVDEIDIPKFIPRR
jgi:hypothetical protein